MKEIDKILEKKERVIWEGKPEYAPYITSIMFIVLIAIIIIGFFIGIFLKSITGAIVGAVVVLILGTVLINMTYTRTHYAITNKRAIIQSGIIGRDFKSIDYDKIQNVSVNVGILGVIFKVGTVNIFTGEIESVSSGNQSSTMQPKYDTFVHINSPYEILKKLQVHLSKRKEGL